jgi:hypothetical protein
MGRRFDVYAHLLPYRRPLDARRELDGFLTSERRGHALLLEGGRRPIKGGRRQTERKHCDLCRRVNALEDSSEILRVGTFSSVHPQKTPSQHTNTYERNRTTSHTFTLASFSLHARSIAKMGSRL